MKRALLTLSLLGLAVLVMAARPGNEQALVQQLNGQPARVRGADGGPWGVFTMFDGGAANSIGCVPLTGTTTTTNSGGTSNTVSANVIMLTPMVPVNVCIAPSVGAAYWDGGCNFNPQDLNFGIPMAAGVPQYITPDYAARWLCAVSDAGYVSLPMWWAQ